MKKGLKIGLIITSGVIAIGSILYLRNNIFYSICINTVDFQNKTVKYTIGKKSYTSKKDIQGLQVKNYSITNDGKKFIVTKKNKVVFAVDFEKKTSDTLGCF